MDTESGGSVVSAAYLLSVGWIARDGGFVDPQGATGEPVSLERALVVQAGYDRLDDDDAA